MIDVLNRNIDKKQYFVQVKHIMSCIKRKPAATPAPRPVFERITSVKTKQSKLSLLSKLDSIELAAGDRYYNMLEICRLCYIVGETEDQFIDRVYQQRTTSRDLWAWSNAKIEAYCQSMYRSLNKKIDEGRITMTSLHDAQKPSQFISNRGHIPKDILPLLTPKSPLVDEVVRLFAPIRKSKQSSVRYYAHLLLEEVIGTFVYQYHNRRKIKKYVRFKKLTRYNMEQGIQISRSTIKAMKEHYNIKNNIDMNKLYACIMKLPIFLPYMSNRKGYLHGFYSSCKQFILNYELEHFKVEENIIITIMMYLKKHKEYWLKYLATISNQFIMLKLIKREYNENLIDDLDYAEGVP